MEAGIYPTLDEATYHAGPGISKTGLWTIHTRTPFHFRYGEKKETNTQKFGTAAHLAVLEPSRFEARVARGPADRRGNKWKDAENQALLDKQILVTESDYEDALRLRDAVHRDPLVQQITSGAQVEHSAYWIDPATGELLRCRPDVYNPAISLMADLKATADASPGDWWRRIRDYGYHVQQPLYSEGWTLAGGGPVAGFCFIVVEMAAPFAHVIYELDVATVQHGYSIYRHALDTYHACKVADRWPGYGEGVTPIGLRLDLQAA